MRHPLSIFATALIAATAVSTSACSDGDIAVGKTNEELTTKKDGSPTGDGQICSWESTSLYDGAAASGTTSSANSSYPVGAEFASLDGCNECTCTVRGIMCTVRACGGGTSPGGPGPGPGQCSTEAKLCPDGTAVGRSGPKCEFTPCPGTGPIACAADAKQCPDGSYVGRTGPNCEFVCPPPKACSAEAKLCPDGSYVARTGPNCEFAPCP